MKISLLERAKRATKKFAEINDFKALLERVDAFNKCEGEEKKCKWVHDDRMSPKANDVAALMYGGGSYPFGCRTKKLAQLISKVLSEKIIIPNDDNDEENFDSHEYEIEYVTFAIVKMAKYKNELFMTVESRDGDFYFLDKNFSLQGGEGSDRWYGNIADGSVDIKPATEKEINTFFKGIV
jgi:hypothetical protein